jgi:3-deoxy-D-manno-octulosonic-acid transferase
MVILFFLYTILLELIYFLLSPILFALFRTAPKTERLAIAYPNKQYDIMVHAASVGEINGIKQLLIELLEANQDLSILLTTNTKTGRKTAVKLHPSLDVIISPLDVLHLRIKQMSLSKPRLILIAETEIWPQLLFAAKLNRIPVVYINARISRKTFETFSKFNTLMKWLGRDIKTVCAQSEADRERFSLLFNTKCIRLGNLKFSVKQPEYEPDKLRALWGYKLTDKIITFGSSRPGEESLILKSYDELKQEFPELKLIIAPRHLERLPEINNLLEHREVSYFSHVDTFASNVLNRDYETDEASVTTTHVDTFAPNVLKTDPTPPSVTTAHTDIHIIDELGHLLPAYALCDIAIIGGSFYPFGGHNPLEAAFYSKVIVMGQYHESCLGSVKKLKKADAIILSSFETLSQDLRNILTDPEKYRDYGTRAKQVLSENSESLPQTLAIINKYL